MEQYMYLHHSNSVPHEREVTVLANYYGETNIKKYKFAYTWKIINLKNINFGEANIISPKFIIDWKGELFKLFLGLTREYLQCRKKSYCLNIRHIITPFTLGIKPPISSIEFSVLSKEGIELNKIKILLPDNLNQSNSFLASKDGEFTEFLVNGDLKIICEISFVDCVNEFCSNSVQDGQDLAVSENRLREFDDFERFLGDAKFSDIKISVVGGHPFYVHKVILSRSSYFATMFEHNMKENIKNEIEIDDISHEVMNEVLRFIYAGKVNNIEKLASDLFVAADKYNLQRLKDMCEDVLIKKLDKENIAEIINLVDHCKAPRLRSAAIMFIKLNGLQFLKTKEMAFVLAFLDTCEDIKDDDYFKIQK